MENEAVITSQNQRIKQLENELNMYKNFITNKNSEVDITQKNSRMIGGERLQGSSHTLVNSYPVEGSMNDQINRLNTKLMEKKKDYEKLYQKYYQLEVDNANLENYVEDLERQRKFLSDKLKDIEIHTEGDEVIGELENKVVLMSTQIIRLGNLNKSKSSETSELKHKVKQLQEGNRLLQSELTEKQEQIQIFMQRVSSLEQSLQNFSQNTKYENQSTYRILSEQIQRLNTNLHNSLEKNRVLEIRFKQVERQKERVHHQKQVSESRQTQRKQQELQWNLEQLQRENETLKRQIRQIQESNRKYKRNAEKGEEAVEQWKQKYSQAEKQLYQSRQMVESRHNFQIRQKQRQIQEKKEIIQRYENSASEQRMKVQSLTFSYESQVEGNRNLRKTIEEEACKYQVDMKHMKSKLTEAESELFKYEEKIVLLSQEIERLTNLSQRYQQNVADSRIRLEEKDREIREKDKKIREKDNDLIAAIRAKESANAEFHQQKSQKDRIRMELRENIQKNRQLQSQIFHQRSLKDECEVLKERLQSRNNEYKFLEKKFHEQMLQLQDNRKMQELEERLRKQQIQFSKKQSDLISQFEGRIVILRESNENLQQKLVALSSQHHETENNYILLADEIQRLNQIIAQCNSELIKAKRTVTLLEENLQIAQSSLHRIKESSIPSQKVEEQIKIRIEGCQKEIRMLEKENNSLKLKYSEVSQAHEYAEKQWRELNNQKEGLERTLANKQQQLRERINSFTQMKNNESNLLKYISEIKTSNDRLETRMSQIEEDYIKRLSEKDKDVRNWSSDLHDAQKKYRQLESDHNDKKYTIVRLTNRIELAEKEIENLQQQIKEKNTELKFFQRQKAEKQRQFQTSFEEFRNQEVNRNQTKIKILQDQLSKAYISINQLNQDKRQQQTIIDDLGEELDIVRKQHESELRMIRMDVGQQTQGKPQSFYRPSSSSPSYDQQKSIQIKQKYEILEGIHLRVKKEAENLQEKVTQYEFKMKKLKGEFDLINRLTHQYKDENDYLRQTNHSQCIFIGKSLQNQAVSNPSHQQNKGFMEEQLIKETLTNEIQRLQILNDGLRTQVEDLRIIMSDNASLRERMNENLSLMVIMMAQIEALRNFKAH